MNSYKMDFMYFKQSGAISSLNDNHLKFVDHFTIPDDDVNICIRKIYSGYIF